MRPPHHTPIEIDNRPVLIFLTVCTKHRKKILTRPETIDLIVASWHKATAWLIGKYVILPDHIHLFCTPSALDSPPLATWVKFWKTKIANSWPHPMENPIWQPSFWDTQLRTGDSYSQKWQYVRSNPVRHNLAPSPELWPHQGELTQINWHAP